MATRLTREGARNLTATIDRIASAVQDNASLLGIDAKIAKDFAYRCDLISDAVETTAVANTPKMADENTAVPSAGDVYMVAKPGIQKEIGEETDGPIYEEDPASSTDIDGHFTQEKFHELTEMAEKLEKAASAITAMASKKAPVADHGFNLTK